MTATNRQIQLASRPIGTVKPDNWAHVTASAAAPGDGEFAGRTRVISLDPAMRGWLDDRPSYIPPVGLNEVMRALAGGEVVASNHPGFAVGEHVTGVFGVQEYAVSDGRGLQKVDPAAVPMTTYLSALGMTGMTAYFGLFDVGALKDGETVLVSGAAGAVGSMAGQIAKLMGAARVIGSAGSDEKTSLLVNEFGFDAAINYRTGPITEQLRQAAPDGIDVYFDNVGGDHLEAAIDSFNSHGRVVLCGMSAQYNDTAAATAPRNLLLAINKRLRLEGMIVTDHHDLREQFVREAVSWIREDKLRYRETVAAGLAHGVDAFLGMLRGENTGKMVVRLDA